MDSLSPPMISPHLKITYEIFLFSQKNFQLRYCFFQCYCLHCANDRGFPFKTDMGILYLYIMKLPCILLLFMLVHAVTVDQHFASLLMFLVCFINYLSYCRITKIYMLKRLQLRERGNDKECFLFQDLLPRASCKMKWLTHR